MQQRSLFFSLCPKSLFLLLGLILFHGQAVFAEPASEKSNLVEDITVHGKSLVGNLEGNSPDRSVTVFLPPSYHAEPNKRYPVVYGLHGYSINNQIWAGELQALEGLYAKGVEEMIVVLPSAQTLHNGSMYASSITIGDWETFIAEELVSYIDKHYRSLPHRDSRGLMGHSMGGHGVARIGMKRPDVFSALYIMSPCCMSARTAPPADMLAKLESLETAEASTSLGFLERATLAVAAAWSPNPHNPPFYADLPTGSQEQVDSVLASWAANAPLSMAHQYIANLKKYSAIYIDVGDQDGLKVDAQAFSKLLNDSGVDNQFEIYEGDHVSGVSDRFKNHALPFFSKHLKR
ncbi:MAG TPA: alpha/beta fold hydrolase [Cellvibrionaceae bacterium]